MTTKHTGGNAFPIPGLMEDENFNGMSLRDYFAAKAIEPQPLFPRSALQAIRWFFGMTYIASRFSVTEKSASAYEYADAMLKARE